MKDLDRDSARPVEPDADPPTDAAPIGPEDSDVEGHSMLQMELHRQIATSRSREAADWARSEKARREAHTDKKRR